MSAKLETLRLGGKWILVPGGKWLSISTLCAMMAQTALLGAGAWRAEIYLTGWDRGQLFGSTIMTSLCHCLGSAAHGLWHQLWNWLTQLIPHMAAQEPFGVYAYSSLGQMQQRIPQSQEDYACLCLTSMESCCNFHALLRSRAGRRFLYFLCIHAHIKCWACRWHGTYSWRLQVPSIIFSEH